MVKEVGSGWLIKIGSLVIGGLHDGSFPKYQTDGIEIFKKYLIAFYKL